VFSYKQKANRASNKWGCFYCCIWNKFAFADMKFVTSEIKETLIWIGYKNGAADKFVEI